MSLRAKLEQIYADGRRELPQGLAEICDAHEAGVAAAKSNLDLKTDAVDRLVAEQEDRTLAAIEKLQQETVAAAQKALDQEEGQIRAQFQPKAMPMVMTEPDFQKLFLRRIDDQERLMTGRLFIEMAHAVDSPDQLEELVDETMLFDDPRVTRVVLAIARHKLESQRNAIPLNQRSGHRLEGAAFLMAQRERKYHDARPSPTRRLQQLEEARSRQATLIEQKFTFALKVMFGEQATARVLRRKDRAELTARAKSA
jgi:hypothetical protein